MEAFLQSTEIIDWQHPSVLSQAQQLSRPAGGATEIARRCFEWVRDNIEHSLDYRRNPVTCAASEVLANQTGFCYAKSHLLAALLRANGIPAGFCYQRLSIDETGPPYSLHGFNAAYLPEFGWYRMDPRGNKLGVDAQFSPPVERLAFGLTFPGVERDFADILPDPLSVVVAALGAHRTWEALLHNLPDWDQPTLHG
jgi:transglutaminase-like putative cysteine protease